MKTILDRILIRYKTSDQEMFLKAKFILIATMTVIVSLVFSICYTAFLNTSPIDIFIIEGAGLAAMLMALIWLVKGRFIIAAHMILITGFSTVWMVIWVDPSASLLMRGDTIVFAVALMSVMPLMLFKTRKPMMAYFLINWGILGVFCLYLFKNNTLSRSEYLDVFLDYSISMGFVFMVSAASHEIHKQALNVVRKELISRERTEKALKESENRLSIHLQNTPVGAISWDLAFRVTEWNPSAQTIFGFTKRQALGRHACDLIFSEDVGPEVTQMFEDLLAGKGGERNVNENITKDGNRILCDWFNTALTDTEGRTIGVASLVNDITERRKTQEMMIQSEKMLSVGGLAAGMAHEINNPLSGMIQSAQVIHNRLTQHIPGNENIAADLGISMEKIHAYMDQRQILSQLDHIRNAGQRMAQIVENMLSFARKNDTARHETDLVEMMEDTLDLAQNDYNLKKKYDFKSIEIRKEFARNLPFVFCEKSKIQQVLFNIIKNASEAMQDQADVMESPCLILRVYKENTMVCIEIQDNGPGIAPDVKNRIFEPFFTTKDVNKGTGLGLSVSYFIVVDDHGGKMGVESEPGQGTCFTIKLPIRQ